MALRLCWKFHLTFSLFFSFCKILANQGCCHGAWTSGFHLGLQRSTRVPIAPRRDNHQRRSMTRLQRRIAILMTRRTSLSLTINYKGLVPSHGYPPHLKSNISYIKEMRKWVPPCLYETGTSLTYCAVIRIGDWQMTLTVPRTRSAKLGKSLMRTERLVMHQIER